MADIEADRESEAAALDELTTVSAVAGTRSAHAERLGRLLSFADELSTTLWAT